MALKNLVEQYAKNFQLTERETEVFYHLANRTVSPVELGKKLDISLHTVNNHLKKILEKTRSDSKTELLADFLLFMEKQKLQSDTPSVPPRVLILDDETDLTSILQQFFQLRGIESHTYNDPVLALDAIRKLKIDVVISDIRMPRMNGLSFLAEIRKLHFYEPGLIFISGYPEEYELESLLDLGAFAFLEKPVNLEKLHRLVWEYVYGNPKQENVEASVALQLGNVNLITTQLGFGGFFLDQKQLTEKPGVRLDPGGKVELQFRLPDSEDAHHAVCEVIWKRNEPDSAPGYGLKFVELSALSKRKVLDLVRTNNILSFIPKNEG
ncbi:MAG: response regulator [Bacteriovoracia bacterium]